MKLGIEHQQPRTSQKEKQQYILRLLMKIHNNTYRVAKGIKREYEQASGSNFQFMRNGTVEPFNLNQVNTLSKI